MSFSFPKSARLVKRRQFRAVSAVKQRLVGQFLVVDYRWSRQEQGVRLGIAVTKKFGGAVERNRFKRMAREAFRLGQAAWPGNLDMVLRPRSAAHGARSSDLHEDLKSLIAKLKEGQDGR